LYSSLGGKKYYNYDSKEAAAEGEVKTITYTRPGLGITFNSKIVPKNITLNDNNKKSIYDEIIDEIVEENNDIYLNCRCGVICKETIRVNS
jgi:hypothetical protein